MEVMRFEVATSDEARTHLSTTWVTCVLLARERSCPAVAAACANRCKKSQVKKEVARQRLGCQNEPTLNTMSLHQARQSIEIPIGTTSSTAKENLTSHTHTRARTGNLHEVCPGAARNPHTRRTLASNPVACVWAFAKSPESILFGPDRGASPDAPPACMVGKCCSDICSNAVPPESRKSTLIKYFQRQCHLYPQGHQRRL